MVDPRSGGWGLASQLASFAKKTRRKQQLRGPARKAPVVKRSQTVDIVQRPRKPKMVRKTVVELAFPPGKRVPYFEWFLVMLPRSYFKGKPRVTGMKTVEQIKRHFSCV